MYGPDLRLKPYLAGIGHSHDSGVGLFQPLIRTPKGVIPHVVFANEHKASVSPFSIQFPSETLSLFAEGKAFVPLVPKSIILKSSYRARSILNAIHNHSKLSMVNPGDTVLIAPGNFTGGTDFTDTPMGRIPGSFIIASLLNAQIKNQWISHAPLALAILSVFIFFGLIAKIKHKAICVFLFATAWPTLALFGFAYFHFYLPTTLPLFWIIVLTAIFINPMPSIK